MLKLLVSDEHPRQLIHRVSSKVDAKRNLFWLLTFFHFKVSLVLHSSREPESGFDSLLLFFFRENRYIDD